MTKKNNTYAFIFPGQASQEVGMGQDFFERYARVREIYEAAEAYLKFPLREISFRGPLEELTQTRITQPAIFVMSCAVDMLLKERGFVPDVAAGHSLGEFSALVSAEALSFKQGLKLVKLRGELMQKAGEIKPGAMAAVIGLEAGKVEKVCRETEGIVIAANYNSPGQLVISGEVEAVETAMESAKNAGAKIVTRLNVSGAFHSPLMEFACEELYNALDETKFAKPRFPVYHNAAADTASSPDEIRALLKKQLISPVKWEQSMQAMAPLAEIFLEVGPGKVLTGLLKRIERGKSCFPINNIEAMEKL